MGCAVERRLLYLSRTCHSFQGPCPGDASPQCAHFVPPSCPRTRPAGACSPLRALPTPATPARTAQPATSAGQPEPDARSPSPWRRPFASSRESKLVASIAINPVWRPSPRADHSAVASDAPAPTLGSSFAFVARLPLWLGAAPPPNDTDSSTLVVCNERTALYQARSPQLRSWCQPYFISSSGQPSELVRVVPPPPDSRSRGRTRCLQVPWSPR